MKHLAPDKRLTLLVALNASILVASNAGGAKMIGLPFGLAASATVFSYAITFLITDLISEVYGADSARNAVRTGFLGIIISVIFFKIAIWSPPAPGWPGQDAYDTTLGLGARILAGGWTSYMVSQHLDVWIFHRLKAATNGKHLWLRNNLSTAGSQLIDTCIFMTIAFGGVFPLGPAILGQYLIKLIIAAFDTPLVYLGRKLLNRWARETDQAIKPER